MNNELLNLPIGEKVTIVETLCKSIVLECKKAVNPNKGKFYTEPRNLPFDAAKVGERLRERRNELGHNLTDVVDIAKGKEISLHLGTLSNMENGKFPSMLKTANRYITTLCELYGIEKETLLQP